MKIYTITISIILCTFSVYGQIVQGEVNYNVDIDNFVARVVSGNQKESSKKMFIDASKQMDNISMTLSFNKNYGFFEKDKNLVLDGNELASKMAMILTDKGSFYTDLTKNMQLLVREVQGKKFNVKMPIEKIDWLLTKESKKIGDFTCYKATMTVETPGGSFPRTAWYTPEIPIAYGPGKFVGSLPGLILELHDTDMSYTCSSITLQPKDDIVIDWPEGVETISEEAYKNEGDNMGKKLRSNGN